MKECFDVDDLTFVIHIIRYSTTSHGFPALIVADIGRHCFRSRDGYAHRWTIFSLTQHAFCASLLQSRLLSILVLL